MLQYMTVLQNDRPVKFDSDVDDIHGMLNGQIF
jgi:hypothetical protein